MAGYADLFGGAPQGWDSTQETPELGIGNMNEAPGQGASPDALTQNLGEVQAFGLFQKATNEDGQIEPASWSIDSAGRVKGDMPAKDFFQLLGGFRQNQQTQAAFNAEALRLKAQEDKIRANPLMAILSAVAAGAAQQPNMPGIVRALGAANASLNPSADSLAQRRMGILQTLAQMESHGAAAAETRAYRETQIENTRADNARADRAQAVAEGKAKEAEVQHYIKNLADPADVDALPGLTEDEKKKIKAGVEGRYKLELRKNKESLDIYRSKAGIREKSKMAEIHARGAEARLTQRDIADFKNDLGQEMVRYKLNARNTDPTVRATTMGRLYGTSAYLDQAIQKYQFVLTNPMADDEQKALAKKMIDEVAQNKIEIDGLLQGMATTSAPAAPAAAPAAPPAPAGAPKAAPAAAPPRPQNPNIVSVRRVGGGEPPRPTTSPTPAPTKTATPRPSTTNPPPPKKLGSVGSGSSWFASQLKAEDERLRRSKR